MPSHPWGRIAALSLLWLSLASTAYPAPRLRQSQAPTPPLVAAAKAGDLASLQALLARGAAVDGRDNEGRTALIAAVEHGQEEIVQALLAHGARINATDRDGRTPLTVAVWNLDSHLAALLLQHGADPKTRDKEGRTPLIWAASWTQYDLVAGQEQRAAALVPLLVKAGAEVDARDRKGMTALMWAAGWDHPEVIRALLKHRPDINATDHHGRSALTWAARQGKESPIVAALLRQGAQLRLADALLLGEREQARTLLAAGAPLQVRGGYEETVLMMAAEQDYPEIVRALLAKGVPVNRKDEQGMTALLLAVAGRFRSSSLVLSQEWTKGKSAPGRVEVVQALLDAGADPRIKTNDGKTALMIAREIGAEDVIALLQQPRRVK